MANVKISGLPSATTPLAGTEVLPIVQGGVTDQVSVANLTAGRAIAALSVTTDTHRAATSAGGTLSNSGGTACFQWGAGGGVNATVDGSINMNGSGAAIQMSPTSGGTVTIAPNGASTMNNVAIGGTTPLAGTFTALKTNAALQQTRTAVAASDINLATGNFFSKTISGTTTFTVSNVPTTGTAASLVLDLTNGGSATVNWWAGVKWAAGTPPTLTASGRDSLGFYTYDGGTTWTGLVLGLNLS
jgi:hypothetical protein